MRYWVLLCLWSSLCVGEVLPAYPNDLVNVEEKATSSNTSSIGSLSSTHASYDGQVLTLTGEVKLDHGLGRMMAEKALLTQQSDPEALFPFSRIQLHRDVLLSMKNRAELRCGHADLDFTSLKGILHAEEGEKVAYTDPSQHELHLFSRQLELQFAKSPVEVSTYEVDAIFAHQDVEIHYANTFVLSADRAIYSHTPLTNKITAYPKDAKTPCRLTHQNDLILTDTIQWDLTHQTIDTDGLTTLSYQNAGSTIQHQVVCRGHIHLDQVSMTTNLDSPETEGLVRPEDQLCYQDGEMTLYADQAIIQHTLINGKITPSTLTLNGHVRLSSHGPAVRCAIADHLRYSFHSQVLALSANPEQKVLFVDETQKARISANEVHLIHDAETGTQTIKGIGNIRAAFNAEENALLQQFFPSIGTSHE